jgi:hypothetical protein
MWYGATFIGDICRLNSQDVSPFAKTGIIYFKYGAHINNADTTNIKVINIENKYILALPSFLFLNIQYANNMYIGNSSAPKDLNWSDIPNDMKLKKT